MHKFSPRKGSIRKEWYRKNEKTGEGEKLPHGDIALVSEGNLVKWSRLTRERLPVIG
jgi:hypothetical protein